MSLVLYQAPDDGTNGIVTPESDAKAFSLATGEICGIVTGADVPWTGGNNLQIRRGWGIIHGRCFGIEQETVLVKTSANGVVSGRLIIRIDLSNDPPIAFATQAAEFLPELTQEDLSAGGSVYELPLATYRISETTISDLVVLPRVERRLNQQQTELARRRYVIVVLRPEWWSGAAPYTYTIQVPGMTEDWIPGIPWHNWWDGLTNEDLTKRLEEMSKIKLIRSANGSLTFTAPDEKPDCALDLCVPGEVYSGTTKSDYS